MNRIKRLLKSLPLVGTYWTGRNLLGSPYFAAGQAANRAEALKRPTRTEILNFLLSLPSGLTRYLEIGVRDPDSNFNLIDAKEKYSVDPGVEIAENTADFKVTSDAFFEKLSNGEILDPKTRFDVIFIDGLHLADQVDRDIRNSLKYVTENGFVALHDCNPPTEWHARETYDFHHTPAADYWNGTTWKAFLKWRSSASVKSCCVDADFGVGILSPGQPLGDYIGESNPFFEFSKLEANRKDLLGLIDFVELKARLNKG